MEGRYLTGLKMLSSQSSPSPSPSPAGFPHPLMKAVSNLRRPNDPFAAALMPPPEETEEERVKRVREQAEAARVSREIDESLQEAKKLIEKRKKAIKVLLLGKPAPPHRTSPVFIVPQGQAESGKSTTLKSERPPAHTHHYSSSPSHDCRPTTDFQLSFCPSQFIQERAAWRSVIQLNLIK